jgi:hypothetical protein
MKIPSKFKPFQNHLCIDMVMDDAGCKEYRFKLAEIYGFVLVRSFLGQ